MNNLTRREKRLLELYQAKKITAKDIVVYFTVIESNDKRLMNFKEETNMSLNTLTKCLNSLEEADLIEIRTLARKLGTIVNAKN